MPAGASSSTSQALADRRCNGVHAPCLWLSSCRQPDGASSIQNRIWPGSTTSEGRAATLTSASRWLASMIPKSVYRFSEKHHARTISKAGWRFEEKSSRFSCVIRNTVSCGFPWNSRSLVLGTHDPVRPDRWIAHDPHPLALAYAMKIGIAGRAKAITCAIICKRENVLK
jgi:hypothetical protein